MLITLLLFIYITFVSWTIGAFFVNHLYQWFSSKETVDLGFFEICFLGFTLITGFTGLLSLFTPIDTLWIHLFLIFTAFLILIKRKQIVYVSFLPFKKIALPAKLIGGFSMLVILIMSTWKIAHPDTIEYHQHIIQTIEKWGIIKGAAAENIRFGLQSNWFLACALFSFQFTGLSALTFINTTLLLWFVLFITQRIHYHYTCAAHKKNWNTLLWLGLLLFAFWDYTQIRLTATSASPDFIVAIFVWCIFYLYLKHKKSYPLFFILLLLSLFVITIKLSAYLLGLLALVLFFGIIQIKIKKLIVLIGFALFIIVPFLLRNVYTSGYLLFPSPTPDLFEVDWKINAQRLIETNDYITAYARAKSGSVKEEVEFINKSKFTDWGPIWWRFQSTAQKLLHVLLATASLLILVNLFRLKNFFSLKEAFILLICFCGIISWWILAPDLRFGYAYYLPIIGITINALFIRNQTFPLSNRIPLGISIVFALGLCAYVAYRIVFYFDLGNLLYPYGIQ